LAWTRRFIAAFGEPFRDTRPRDPQRRLRIGWLSPRFSDGPVTTFFTGLLGAFDRSGFEHCLVPLRASDAPANARLRELADDWFDARTLGDATLLQRLREMNFDIVIDLAGHSFGHRLAVLAQRVAPIQLCWLDYFDTTAVAAMDGWISDAWLTPDGSSQHYTERLLRLDTGRFCYTPPPDAPDTRRIGDGPPLFASFNRLAKLNDQVVDAWAQILQRVPDAQLELGAHLLGDAVANARTLQRFAERGIGAERLRLHAQRSYAELLAAYQRVDIALDPFPFSGCTTSCDALWMGVPVIALQGETFVARQSASLLARLGRSEWIAHDANAYIELAVRAAANVEALRAGREQLREQTRVRLCDATAQAHDFAALLRALWIEHCALP
jgi:predicted O-linked N-acetylglucosamine transferase (SPINDLY family)